MAELTREETVKKACDDAAARMDASKPTPTQDENDRAKMGEDVATKEDDGGGPDPGALAAPQSKHSKSMEAKPAPASYSTKQQTPAKPAT